MSESDVLTASPVRALRRRGGWIVVIVIVVLAAIALVVIRSSSSASTDPLDATNPAPAGARAVVQVLEQHGVHVVTTDSLRATRQAVDAAGDPGDVTVMAYDPEINLSTDQLDALLRLRTDVVAVEPDLLSLHEFVPSAGLAGALGGTFDADCDVTAVRKAVTVTAKGDGYRLLPGTSADGSGNTTACLTKNGSSGLVQFAERGRTITVLGLATALENGTIATRGDAALALNLLGEHRTLIWYISTFADLQGGPDTQTLADLTLPWVSPLLVLLAIAGLAAMFWRGRRFGPIVVENLPVVVRASETMEGRARLYSRAGARLRALDALRIGTVDRLARALGLPRAASVEQVVDAVAELLGRDRGGVSLVLLEHVPSTDSELVHLSDQLLTLEKEVSENLKNGQHG